MYHTHTHTHSFSFTSFRQTTRLVPPPPPPGPCPPLTSDLLLQAEDDGHRLVQDEQLGLRLLTLQVQLAHVAQLLEGLVDVPHAQTLPGVVGHAPLALAFCLLLRAQVLILVKAESGGRGTREV